MQFLRLKDSFRRLSIPREKFDIHKYQRDYNKYAFTDPIDLMTPSDDWAEKFLFSLYLRRWEGVCEGMFLIPLGHDVDFVITEKALHTIEDYLSDYALDYITISLQCQQVQLDSEGLVMPLHGAPEVIFQFVLDPPLPKHIKGFQERFQNLETDLDVTLHRALCKILDRVSRDVCSVSIPMSSVLPNKKINIQQLPDHSLEVFYASTDGVKEHPLDRLTFAIKLEMLESIARGQHYNNYKANQVPTTSD